MPSRDAAAQARLARRAEALRTNLKRRKAQTRDRAEAHQNASTAAPDHPG